MTLSRLLSHPLSQGLTLGGIVYIARARYGLHPAAATGLGVVLGALLILVSPPARGGRKAEFDTAIYETTPKRVKQALDKLPAKDRERVLNRLETEVLKYAPLAA